MIGTVLRNISGLRGRYTGFAIVIAVLVGAGSAGLIIDRNIPAVYQAQIENSVASRTVIAQVPVGSDLRLDDEAITELRSLPGVETVEETYALSGDLTFGDVANAVPMSLLPLRSTVVPPLVEGTTELGEREALVPAVVDGRSLTGSLGSDITILRNVALRPGETRSRQETLRVVGLVEPYWQVEGRNPVYLPPALAREWLADATGLGPGSIPREGFSSVSVVASPRVSSDSVLAAVQDLGYQASTAAQIGGEIPESLQSFVALSSAIRYAGTIVGLIVAFVFVRTVLLSRLPEVGLLKSFGYPTARIVATLCGEVLVISLIAALVGLVLGGAAAYAVAAGVGDGVLPPGSALTIAVPPAGLALAVIVVTAAAVTLAAALPIMRAARQPAMVALRTRK